VEITKFFDNIRMHVRYVLNLKRMALIDKKVEGNN